MLSRKDIFSTLPWYFGRYPWKDRFADLVAKEKKSRLKISLSNRLKMYRHGFLSDSYVLYNLAQNPMSTYLSDYKRFIQTPALNGSYCVLLMDKLAFHQALKPYEDIMPKLYGWTMNGKIYKGKWTPQAELSKYLKAEFDADSRKRVLKPVYGGGGVDIHFLQRDGNKYLFDGQPVDLKTLEGVFKKINRCMISEFIEQADYARQIFPNTANTVRFLSAWDYEQQQPFLARAIHRFGSHKSGNVDNWMQGGVSASIDLETGQLGEAAIYPQAGEEKLVFHKTHPDTQGAIAGVTIPNWQQVKERLLHICRDLYFLPYVGWDLVITNNGFRILEGNHYTDVGIFQVHEGLLTEERLRKFYEVHGVI